MTGRIIGWVCFGVAAYTALVVYEIPFVAYFSLAALFIGGAVAFFSEE